ncbi:hypothetical protein HJFPF1_12974 [Paramyrothecium foliicola]|nr:hypothetical protein HJFPF1_12974 [Paramyrothecium foliicola]
MEASDSGYTHVENGGPTFLHSLVTSGFTKLMLHIATRDDVELLDQDDYSATAASQNRGMAVPNLQPLLITVC